MEELELKIAKDICQLNRFITPVKIRSSMGRELKESEFANAMRILEAYVPHGRWILVWREEIEKKPVGRPHLEDQQ